MTREEWTDTVACMTPDEKEAMEVFGDACRMREVVSCGTLSEWLDLCLAAEPPGLLDQVYANATVEGER